MSAPVITDEQRATLAVKLDDIDARESALRSARAPLEAAFQAIEEEREAALEEHSLSYAGQCEFCSKHLFAGEMGSLDSEGTILCAACAPTYGDIEKSVKDGDYDDDDEAKEAIENLVAAHLANGGSRADKLLQELDGE